MDFREEVFELAFGDNAINRDYTEEEVIARLREFSDKALEVEREKTEEEIVDELSKLANQLKEHRVNITRC